VAAYWADAASVLAADLEMLKAEVRIGELKRYLKPRRANRHNDEALPRGGAGGTPNGK